MSRPATAGAAGLAHAAAEASVIRAGVTFLE
jgi:hypothetical protein